MKMTRLALMSLLIFVSISYALQIGESWPKLSQKLKNVDEQELTLESLKGKKGTLVIFSCNACPFVKAWEDRIVTLGNQYQEKGIAVVAVNSNDPQQVSEDGFDQMKTRYKEKGFKFPYVVDATSDIARTFGATRTPEAFLFDAQGKLIYHGTIDDNAHEPKKVEKRFLEQALSALVENKKIEQAETKAIGCSIKFRAK